MTRAEHAPSITPATEKAQDIAGDGDQVKGEACHSSWSSSAAASEALHQARCVGGKKGWN